jgi:hypothetical protein
MTRGTNIVRAELRYEGDSGNLVVDQIAPRNIIDASRKRGINSMTQASLTVAPADASLRSLADNQTKLAIYAIDSGGETLVFSGTLLAPESSALPMTLEARGPFYRLNRRDATTKYYEDTSYYAAVRDFVDARAIFDGWDVTVYQPSVENVRDDESSRAAGASATDGFDDLAGDQEITDLFVRNDAETKARQTCLTTDGDANDAGTSTTSVTTATADYGSRDLSEDSAIVLDEGGSVEYQLGFDFDLEPGEDNTLPFRWHVRDFLQDDTYAGTIRFLINGEVVGTVDAGNVSQGMDWRDRLETDPTDNDGNPFLAFGNNTYRIEATDEGGGKSEVYAVDAVAPNVDTDPRTGDAISYNFDNTTDANDALAGPELYPDQVVAPIELTDAANTVERIRLVTTYEDSDIGDGGWELRNNLNNDYREELVAEPDVDFGATDDYGTTIDTRAILSRKSSGGTTTPTDGDEPTVLQDYESFVTTTDRAIIEGRKEFTGSAYDILVSQMCKDANFVALVTFEDASPDEPRLRIFREGDLAVGDLGYDTRADWQILSEGGGKSVEDAASRVRVQSARGDEGRTTVLVGDDEPLGTKHKIKPKTLPEEEAKLRTEAGDLLRDALDDETETASFDLMPTNAPPGLVVDIDLQDVIE